MNKKAADVVKNDNVHIYFGIGTLAVILLGAFVVLRKSRNKKRVAKTISNYRLDLSMFDSPDLPGSGSCMDRQLIYMLQQLAARTGYPIFDWINSGARSPEHNRSVGGVSNSSHKIPTCKAVDIKAPTTFIRNHLVMEARNLGFKRIGVGRTFVHLDTDDLKSQYVAWGYPKGTPPPVNPFV